VGDDEGLWDLMIGSSKQEHVFGIHFRKDFIKLNAVLAVIDPRPAVLNPFNPNAASKRRQCIDIITIS
jgi:hypothetical protein